MVQNNSFYGFARTYDPLLDGRARNHNVCDLTGSRSTYSTISQPMTDACFLYANLKNGADNGGVGHKKNKYMAELRRGDGNYDLAVCDLDTGVISTAIYDPVTSDLSDYGEITKGGEKGIVIYLALMPAFEANEDFKHYLEKLNPSLSLSELFEDRGDDDALKTLAILCDVMYRMLQDNILNADIPEQLSFPGIKKQAVKRGSYRPEYVDAGMIRIFNPEGSHTDTVSVFSGNEAKYTIQKLNPKRTYTNEEQALIPVVPNTYIMPEEVVYLQALALGSTGTSNPIRTVMGRGESGAGKTKGMKALAGILNLPYVHFTCGADTELADLQGMMLPVTKEDEPGENAVMINDAILPGTDDIVYNPCGTYEKVFGKNPEGKQIEEIMEALFRFCIDAVKRGKSKPEPTGTPGYRFTDTDIIRAIEHGYLIEIQEPAAILQQGVLVSLNSVTEPDGSIRLANGRFIKRHPDTVICYTTNVDYEGLRPLNQSVLDRVQHLIDFRKPSDRAVIDRCMKLTDFDNRVVVENMLHTVQEIEAHCKAKMVRDGVTGLRSLYNWATGVKVTKRPYITAMTSVISKATSDEKIQAELKGILDQHFTPNERIA